jgi:hypothetical protein
MFRRLLPPLFALAIAACGQAFTTATGDGGVTPGDDGPLDTDAAEDATAGDGASPRDATTEDARPRDAGAKDDGGTKQDGSTGVVDSGPIVSDASPVPDASSCARACPAGFDCILTKCEDRAAVHFSATNNMPFNWSYGYATGEGSSFHAYTAPWTNSSIDVWSTASNSLEPSVFHNSTLLSQTYAEMTVPGAALGLYAGGTGQESIVRWIAPVAGSYAIDATFVGISAPMPAVTVGVFVNGAVGMNSSQYLNAYTEGNTFTFSAPAQTLAADSAVDFIVVRITSLDDPAGGVSLDAHITAE